MLGRSVTAPELRLRLRLRLRPAPRAIVAGSLGRCHGGQLPPHPPAGVCPQKEPRQADPGRAPGPRGHGGRSCSREPPQENREPGVRPGTALLRPRIPADSPGPVITGAAFTTGSPALGTAAREVKPPSSQLHIMSSLRSLFSPLLSFISSTWEILLKPPTSR